MRLTILIAALALNACGGLREDAGQPADVDSAAVDSENGLRNGAPEELGERQGLAAAAGDRAAQASADGLDAMAAEKRARADDEARELENRADELRAQQD